jgi:uncharacterized protein
MADYKKPVPVPSDESRPYWEGLREHRLMMPHCDDCSQFWFPPSQYCQHCRSKNWQWAQTSGRGKVFSFVVYHRLYHPGFAEDLPYAVAVIQLDDGPRMLSNIAGILPDQIICDMPVEATYDDITDEMTIPKFRPLAS